MGVMMIKQRCTILSLIAFLCISRPVFGQETLTTSDELQIENIRTLNNPSTFNKTALRFFEEAKKYLIMQDWESAYSIAEHALVYDNAIADLYYIQAISLFEKGEQPFVVIPLLEKSLSEAETNWYDYNRDAARTLLARLYVDVKRPHDALELVNSPPTLTTADVLYIKAKASYILKDIRAAREYVLNGANQYPLDSRFDALFYAQEYAQKIEADRVALAIEAAEKAENETTIPTDTDGVLKEVTPLEETQTININDNLLPIQTLSGVEDQESASFENIVIDDEFAFLVTFFNNRIQQFSRDDSMLMLYASIFSNDVEEKNRLLRAWNVQGMKHPLYAIHAAKLGVMNEESAFEYMLPFFNDISLTTLTEFIEVLQEDTVIEKARRYFINYTGTIKIDTDGDLNEELSVFYERGRPAKIIYDENQDGNYSWSMTNDFGEPKSVEIADASMLIEYGTWPFIKKVTESTSEKGSYEFNIVSEALAMPIIELRELAIFKNTLSINFYTPIVLEKNDIGIMSLFNASYLIDFPTTEYTNSRARYTLLDGIIKNAVYTINERPYAYTHFEDGIPFSRNVDRDNDGTYEVIEVYAQNSDVTLDSQKLLNEVFGFSHVAEGQYIQKVYVDLNNDGFDDFSEEYIVTGGTLSSWDSNNDGQWDVQFIQNSDARERQVQYVHPLTGEIQSVEIIDNIPVLANGKVVTLDENLNFYWIGQNMGSSHAEQIITELSLGESIVSLMVTDLLWDSATEQFMRIVGIKNGEMYFGEVYYE